jgi:hypothetical protein
VRPNIEQALESQHENPLLVVRNAINPNDYECRPSLIDAYYESKIAKLTPAENATLNELSDLTVGTWPYLITFFSKKYLSSDTFYPNKQQGTEFAKRFRDAKSTYQPGEIILSALSGKSLC